MRQFIYYPNFESTDETWIKFALLYIDKLNPIIPLSADNTRSELYKKLRDESDLLSFHRPAYTEGLCSSLDAIDIAEKILANPYPYDTLLDHFNTPEYWRNREHFNYRLYPEKFNYEWEMFCLGNGFAMKLPDDSLIMTDNLAMLYMTVFANTISDAKAMPLITDLKSIDKLGYFVRKSGPKVTKEITNARVAVDAFLPAKLENISIDRILQLRNKKDFKQQLAAFHTALEKVISSVEEEREIEGALREYTSATAELRENLLGISLGLISAGLEATALIKNETATPTEIATKIFSGIALMASSALTIKSAWKNTQPRRICRRYLTRLERV